MYFISIGVTTSVEVGQNPDSIQLKVPHHVVIDDPFIEMFSFHHIIHHIVKPFKHLAKVAECKICKEAVRPIAKEVRNDAPLVKETFRSFILFRIQ